MPVLFERTEAACFGDELLQHVSLHACSWTDPVQLLKGLNIDRILERELFEQGRLRLDKSELAEEGPVRVLIKKAPWANAERSDVKAYTCDWRHNVDIDERVRATFISTGKKDIVDGCSYDEWGMIVGIYPGNDIVLTRRILVKKTLS